MESRVKEHIAPKQPVADTSEREGTSADRNWLEAELLACGVPEFGLDQWLRHFMEDALATDMSDEKLLNFFCLARDKALSDDEDFVNILTQTEDVLFARMSSNRPDTGRFARAIEPAAQTAEARANTGATSNTSPRSRDAALAKKADSRSPPVAPNAAKRGTDISSRRRLLSVSARTAENSTPAKKPSTPKMRGNGASASMPRTHRGIIPTTDHAAPHVSPIPIAPRTRRIQFFMAASHRTPSAL